MHFHRMVGKIELSSDHFVRRAASQLREHIRLARREVGERKLASISADRHPFAMTSGSRTIGERGKRVWTEDAAGKDQPQAGKRKLDPQGRREEAANSKLEDIGSGRPVVRVREHRNRHVRKALADFRKLIMQVAPAVVASAQVQHD
ncbi:hypothetical protein D9M70_476930 [compost metagenome]